MNLKLSSPITDVPRIGPAKAKFLQKLGITHARDLLYTFPRRYDDFSRITSIKALKVGEKMTVRGKVKSVKSHWGFRGRQRLLRIFVEIEDETGTLQVTWYNLRFLSKQLWQGRQLFVAGLVEQDKRENFAMRSPVLEFIDASQDQTHTARITPIYPETYGVSSRFLRYQIKNLLPLTQALPEYVPDAIKHRHRLMDIHSALNIIHFPESIKQLEAAKRRLRFDELFFLQLAALVRRQSLQQKKAFPLSVKQSDIKAAQGKLPFTLTDAQQNALQEVIADIQKPVPMNRLLQGDVGSGKSAVALLATGLTLRAGYKTLYLAPTEILARQQASAFADTLGTKYVALLIGATSAKQKKIIKQRLKEPGHLCIVGTHALLQEDVTAQDVALAIIDEQHRFGVAQRRAVQQLGQATMPHLLSMTATPIPRTLNLTVFGDLDVSILDEMPPGRKQTITKIIPAAKRDEAIVHVLEQLHQGRQGYVIAPLIDSSSLKSSRSGKSSWDNVKSAKETYDEIRKLFPGIAVGLIHGQLSAEEKESVMRNFAAGAIQLLVSTAVVEVGVNILNATVMIIEGAERFGLAQLHQFRGRIGRAEHQSYCYLFPSIAKAESNQRLMILARTNNGFIIAEEDLKLRGPGEVYGVAQSGFSDLKVASLLDYATIKIARQEAERLLGQDPELKEYPILKAKVEQKNLKTHFE